MKLKVFFAWFYLIMAILSMILVALLLALIVIFGVWSNLFIIYIIDVVMGIPLILILWDYIKLKKGEENHCNSN